MSSSTHGRPRPGAAQHNLNYHQNTQYQDAVEFSASGDDTADAPEVVRRNNKTFYVQRRPLAGGLSPTPQEADDEEVPRKKLSLIKQAMMLKRGQAWRSQPEGEGTGVRATPKHMTAAGMAASPSRLKAPE